MSKKMKQVCIIGAGSWGTALALTAYRAGQQVTLIPRRPAQADDLNRLRENKVYLPGIFLPQDIKVSSDLAALASADIVLVVTPAQSLRETCAYAQKTLAPMTPWVICAKGIDLQTSKLLSDVSESLLPNPVVILSGPSFADEVGRNLPTAVTLASGNEDAAKRVAACLRHTRFRCYLSDDPRGVQVAGAVKNVLAIASGIVHGRGFGNNATAALITRGLAEVRRLGVALGGKTDTFLGLSGVGDITLTCSSEQSRNMRLGKALGEGASAAEILQNTPYVTEGVPTVAAVYRLSQDLSISMPLCWAVYAILYDHISIDEVIENLLSKQSESEF
jgi:glycerol-3-phosphate dehydrogenase (NAD(P)+)